MERLCLVWDTSETLAAEAEPDAARIKAAQIARRCRTRPSFTSASRRCPGSLAQILQHHHTPVEHVCDEHAVLPVGPDPGGEEELPRALAGAADGQQEP